MAVNPDLSVVADAGAPNPGGQDLFGKLNQRYQMCRNRREQWVSTWEECYEYTLPLRESFFEESPGQRRNDRIYDETAVVGVQEFASRLQAGLVPNFARWADLKAGSEVPEEDRDEINEQLDAITEYVFEVLQQSNFSQETHEAFLDLAVGTACMMVEEGDALNPVRFRAVPLPHIVLEAGPDDGISAVFRKRKVRYAELNVVWPEAVLDPQIMKKQQSEGMKYVDVIEATVRDYSMLPEEASNYYVMLPSEQKIIYGEAYEGIGSNPWVVFRWSKSSGEVYGRGPILNAISAIKTCNLTVELILENAQMAISGMYQVDDDGTLNTDNINLVPGTIIPRSPGSNGLQPINPAGSFDVAGIVLDDMRTNIKRALYNEMLGNPNRTPMSATEVAERMADLSRQIGSAFGRLQAEFVQPVLARVINILVRQGRIEMPVLNGRVAKVVSVSPLSRAQLQQDVVTVDRFLEVLMGRFGPQMLNLFIKGEDTAQYIASKMGVPQGLIRDEAERAELMQALAAMQQQAPEQAPEQI